MVANPTSEPSVEQRVRTEIERTIQRSIKGLEYISTGDPAVGLTAQRRPLLPRDAQALPLPAAVR